MSFRTNLQSIAAAVMLALLADGAQAAVQCPSQSQGHTLARLDGGSLFQGNPADNMLLAPSEENPGGHGVNVWNLPNPEGITLVCRYEGVPTPLMFNLTGDIHSCRQATGSFSCK